MDTDPDTDMDREMDVDMHMEVDDQKSSQDLPQTHLHSHFHSHSHAQPRSHSPHSPLLSRQPHSPLSTYSQSQQSYDERDDDDDDEGQTNDESDDLDGDLDDDDDDDEGEDEVDDDDEDDDEEEEGDDDDDDDDDEDEDEADGDNDENDQDEDEENKKVGPDQRHQPGIGHNVAQTLPAMSSTFSSASVAPPSLSSTTLPRLSISSQAVPTIITGADSTAAGSSRPRALNLLATSRPYEPSTPGASAPSTPVMDSAPVKAIPTITKDSKPRKWVCQKAYITTLGGGQIEVPIWYSQEDMALNVAPSANLPETMDTDYHDQNMARTSSHDPQHHHHHHHHRHHHGHNIGEGSLMGGVAGLPAPNTTRQKMKMKLKEKALRESMDPQDYVNMTSILDRSAKEKRKREWEAERKEKRADRPRKEPTLKAPKERTAGKISRSSTPTGTLAGGTGSEAGPKLRPFVCEIEDCGKRFVDAIQLERHVERHGPKELECDLDDCGKLFSSIMLLRRHQSMVHKRRSQKWEDPPGTTRQRSNRQRRKEKEAELAAAYGDSQHERSGSASMEPDGRESSLIRQKKEPKIREPKPPREPKIKEPKPPKERKAPKAYVPKRLAPRPDLESLPSIMVDDAYDSSEAPSDRHPRAYIREHDEFEADEEEGTLGSMPRRRLDHVPKPRAKSLKRLKAEEEVARWNAGGSDVDNRIDELEDNSGSREYKGPSASTPKPRGRSSPSVGGPPVARPRPFACTHDDCKKTFIDAIQLERHLERHGPKELECTLDGCRKRFSAQMLLRRHQSMVHKRRSSPPSAAPAPSTFVASASTSISASSFSSTLPHQHPSPLPPPPLPSHAASQPPRSASPLPDSPSSASTPMTE